MADVAPSMLHSPDLKPEGSQINQFGESKNACDLLECQMRISKIVFLAIFSVWLGFICSAFTERIHVGTDLTQMSTVGPITRWGFPVWWKEMTPKTYPSVRYYEVRAFLNSALWSIVPFGGLSWLLRRIKKKQLQQRECSVNTTAMNRVTSKWDGFYVAAVGILATFALPYLLVELILKEISFGGLFFGLVYGGLVSVALALWKRRYRLHAGLSTAFGGLLCVGLLIGETLGKAGPTGQALTLSLGVIWGVLYLIATLAPSAAVALAGPTDDSSNKVADKSS